MGASERVRLSDMQQLLVLVNEAHEIASDDLVARKRHLLDGLCRLVGAQVAFLNLLELVDTPAVARLVAIHDQGWAGDAERRVIADYYARCHAHGAVSRDPIDEHLFARIAVRNEPLCIQREQIISDHEWYTHPMVNEVRRAAGIDHLIEASTPAFGGKYVAAVGVHRPLKAQRFTRRERHIVQLFNLAILWLHKGEAQQFANANSPRWATEQKARIEALPPRVRKVFALLLEGLGEKQVAAELGLSRHTVHQYVKMLYASLRVESRAELLARYLRA